MCKLWNKWVKLEGGEWGGGRMHMGVQKFVLHLGTGDATKTDEFLEKFQTAFDPTLLHFQKIILQIYFENHAQQVLFNKGQNL